MRDRSRRGAGGLLQFALRLGAVTGGTEEDEAGEVARIHHTDDVLGAAGFVVNRHAGAMLGDDFGAGFFKAHVGWQRKDALARSHDFAD